MQDLLSLMPLIAIAPKSLACNADNEPPNLPNAVLAPAKITALFK